LFFLAVCHNENDYTQIILISHDIRKKIILNIYIPNMKISLKYSRTEKLDV